MKIGNCKLSVETLIALIVIIVVEWGLLIHAILKGYEPVHYVIIPMLTIGGLFIVKFCVPRQNFSTLFP